MAAEVEEVVAGADRAAGPVGPQDFFPDAGHHFLDRVARHRRRRPRRAIRPRLPREAQQRAAIDLAVGGERQPIEPGDVRRQHVGRQALREVPPQLARGGRGHARPLDHEGRQPGAIGAAASRRIVVTRRGPVAICR